MPALRIISDALSKVFIDGEDHGQIEPEVIGTYNLPIGEHIILLVSPYNDNLKIRRIVHIDYDRVIEFNLSSLLQKNKDILLDLELFRFNRDGKTGFFEPITRTIVIEPVFDSCSTFNKNGYSYVKIDGNEGVINKKGDLIVPCEYSSIDSYDKFFLVRKNDEYGLLDENGKLIFGMIPYKIQACYENGEILGWYYSDGSDATFLNLSGKIVLRGAYDFFSVKKYEGKSFIIAHKNGENYSGKEHVYNEFGRLIIDNYYDDISIEDGLIKVREGDWHSKKEGLYDFDGNVIIPVEYDEVWSYTGGFFNLQKGDKWTVVRFDGARISSWPYSIYRKPTDHCILFSDGNRSLLYNTITNQQCFLQCENVDFFPDGHGHDDENGYIKIYRNGKYGLVGPMPQCRLICDCIYDSVTEFVNGYACVERNHRYGAIDRSGNEIIPCKYGEKFWFSKDGYAEVFNYYKNNEGYILPNDIIDLKDRSVLGFHQYCRVSWDNSYTRTTHPAISVKTNNSKYSFVDFDGRVLGTYDYNFTTISENGYYVANKINGETKRGWVNNFGKEIFSCIYDDICDVGDNLFSCKLNGKIALFNHVGKRLTDFVFDKIFCFNNGFAIAKKATGYGILSSSGNEVTGFTNESIDEFYVGHQFGDHDVYDVDEDSVYLAAEIEGPFRYGIAALNTGESGDSRILIDVHGNRIKLHNLEECTLNDDIGSGLSALDSHRPEIKSRNLRTIEYYTKVSGVTYGERQRYIATLRAGEQLSMRRERQNQFDQNAIALYDSREHHLGYVPKEIASNLAPIMDAGERLDAVVMSVSGGNGYSYGLNIKISGIVNDSQ